MPLRKVRFTNLCVLWGVIHGPKLRAILAVAQECPSTASPRAPTRFLKPYRPLSRVKRRPCHAQDALGAPQPRPRRPGHEPRTGRNHSGQTREAVSASRELDQVPPHVRSRPAPLPRLRSRVEGGIRQAARHDIYISRNHISFWFPIPAAK